MVEWKAVMVLFVTEKKVFSGKSFIDKMLGHSFNHGNEKKLYVEEMLAFTMENALLFPSPIGKIKTCYCWIFSSGRENEKWNQKEKDYTVFFRWLTNRCIKTSCRKTNNFLHHPFFQSPGKCWLELSTVASSSITQSILWYRLEGEICLV